jgi:hypothetical protein
MTPNEYRYWWERASDEEIIEAQHPQNNRFLPLS